MKVSLIFWEGVAMRGTVAKNSLLIKSGMPMAIMLWLILIIIFAMWAVPHYIGGPLAEL